MYMCSLAMGQNIQRKVRIGDTLIVASDGLYDNVSDSDILSYVLSIEDPMELAETMGNLASARGVDKSFASPFMQAAQQAGVAWEGGKADDITIVVAKIVNSVDGEAESLLSTIPEYEA